MTSYPYIWQYLPLALQILAAPASPAGMVGASFSSASTKTRAPSWAPTSAAWTPSATRAAASPSASTWSRCSSSSSTSRPSSCCPGRSSSAACPPHRLQDVRLLRDAGLPRLRRRRPLLRLEEGHPHLGRRQGRPLMATAPPTPDTAPATSRPGSLGKSAVLEALPENAAVLALARSPPTPSSTAASSPSPSRGNPFSPPCEAAEGRRLHLLRRPHRRRLVPAGAALPAQLPHPLA
jgi:hypothetical protein